MDDKVDEEIGDGVDDDVDDKVAVMQFSGLAFDSLREQIHVSLRFAFCATGDRYDCEFVN